MASKPSLLMRILQAIIHRVWTVLFFLTLLSVLAWPITGGTSSQAAIMRWRTGF